MAVLNSDEVCEIYSLPPPAFAKDTAVTRKVFVREVC